MTTETDVEAPVRSRFTPPREGEIFKRMSQVMAKMEAVGKNRRNAQQNYNFRSIDDVYGAAQPALVEAGVFCTPRVLGKTITEVKSKEGSIGTHIILEVEFEWCAPDGSSVTCILPGEAIDYGDKACNKAMSAAYKYAIFQTFAVPIGEGGTDRDADFKTHVPYAEERRPEGLSQGDIAGTNAARRAEHRRKNNAADDTPEQTTMRKEIFQAIMAATKGVSPEEREAWTESLTAFTPKGKDRVPGVRRLEFLSPAKPGKKTGRLEILHAGIKKGLIDAAAYAEWANHRHAEAARAAQDAAAEAPQEEPPEPGSEEPPDNILGVTPEEADDTIAF